MTKSIWVRELKRWDQVKVEVYRMKNWEKVYADELLKYDWMDWMYAKLIDFEWDILNATWYVKKHKDWYFYFIDKE